MLARSVQLSCPPGLLVRSLQDLLFHDVEHDCGGYHEHHDDPKNSQDFAARPVRGNVFPIDLVAACHPLGRLEVGKGGDNEAREGRCDASREV